MVKAPFDRFKIPHKPGVYQFKDGKGKVIYVGKALDLFSRVSSYFSDYSSGSTGVKIRALAGEIKDVETIIVESEIEALVLEANLIKKFLPRFNVRLTDDKDYLYIKITQEKFPKIVTARKHDLKDAKTYFGPFPSAATVKTTLKRLRRVFPWCQNPAGKRPCFYYHIGLCPGPCAAKITGTQYKQKIDHFIKFMQGRSNDLKGKLQAEMDWKAHALQFEKAADVKKTLQGIEYLLQANKTQLYLENPNFLQDQDKKGLVELQQVLNLPQYPQRIECFDVSNTAGQLATASMVVLTDGEADKSQYRKFKITISGKPNDYAMMAEAVGRRLTHPQWPYPQLMLIDGGRGQVRSAKFKIKNSRFTKRAKLKIPVYGLAKRLEWIYPSDGEPIKLKRSSLALRLLQKIRDEAHRFAITYHKKLRSNSFLP